MILFTMKLNSLTYAMLYAKNSSKAGQKIT